MPTSCRTILGKPVIVENRPGASLMLAANAVAQSAPDGHTLLVSTSSAMAINLTLFKQVTYDPDRDFIPVSLYVKSPFILVVNPDVPAKTVPELIKYIKENQGKLSYSSPGAGVAQHLSMEYMKNQFGLEITHVPYRATPQSIQDIAAGHIALGWAEAGASLPLIKDGKLRALAVSSLTRLPLLPDVPPFAEAAPAPGFEAVSWHMLLAPAKTPRDIVDRLHAEMKRVLAEPDLKQKIETIGLIPFDTPGIEELRAYRKCRAGEVGRAGEEARAGRARSSDSPLVPRKRLNQGPAELDPACAAARGSSDEDGLTASAAASACSPPHCRRRACRRCAPDRPTRCRPAAFRSRGLPP